MLKRFASQSGSFGLFGSSGLSGFWLNETNQMNQKDLFFPGDHDCEVDPGPLGGSGA
jgi:hypothetical protein